MKQKIKHLDFYVTKTLEYLEKWNFPKFKIEKNEKNIFMGSGSAACAAKLFAERFNGSTLNVSNYKRFFKGISKESTASTYIISASGGKDAVNMAKFLNKMNLRPNLITCNESAPAKKLCNKLFVFPSLKEPPTYNVSTYSSMIYWLFGENIKEIKSLIKNIKIPNLRKYKYIFFLATDKYDTIAKMTSRKIAESLEGIGSNGDGFSNSAHGMLRQPNKDRLIFCLNQKYPFKENVYELKINSYLGLMLATYYIIGKNQKEKDAENLLKNYQQTIKKLNWKINKVF